MPSLVQFNSNICQTFQRGQAIESCKVMMDISIFSQSDFVHQPILLMIAGRASTQFETHEADNKSCKSTSTKPYQINFFLFAMRPML